MMLMVNLSLPCNCSTNADSAVAGPGSDPFNNPSTHWCKFLFLYSMTLGTDLDIKTDGTDKFTGAVIIAVDGSKQFLPAGATNELITLNGDYKRWYRWFNWFESKMLYRLQQIILFTFFNLIGSGSIATPFAYSVINNFVGLRAHIKF